MFLTATRAVGAAVPPKVMATPGTRHVMTQRSGLSKRWASRLESPLSSARSSPGAGAGTFVTTWQRGNRGLHLLEGVEEDEEVLELGRLEPRRHAVLVAAAARTE